MSRYVVGIDLGTTNCALAYADTARGRPTTPRADPDAGRSRRSSGSDDVGDRPRPALVPLPARGQGVPAGALDLPWKNDRRTASSGTFAREHGAKVPGRLVGSAKSWLSHPGVDRRSPILPWNAPEDVAKVSPVEASAAYLAPPPRRLEPPGRRQDGRRPARAPGRPPDRPRLVRRRGPRADRRGRPRGGAGAGHAAGGAAGRLLRLARPPRATSWRKQVKVGDILLVCDVGGGTTDFTLIARRPTQGGDLVLTRLAVGEHILLGGDNMDLALAHAVAATLPDGMEGLDAAPARSPWATPAGTPRRPSSPTPRRAPPR